MYINNWSEHPKGLQEDLQLLLHLSSTVLSKISVISCIFTAGFLFIQIGEKS
jgi:hypothetical protein